jgi:hypothetical protein
MRLLAIIAAGLAIAAGVATALFLRADRPPPAHANARLTQAATPAKRHVLPQATSRRVRLGVISYDVPLFVRQTGIHPALTAKYINWGAPFPAAEIRADHRLGATTVLVLEPRAVSPASIAAGRDNAFLATWARAERTLGLPVILAFAPEANGYWYSWGKGHISPALYKKMYRKVHNVMLRDGARRITWLWQVNRISRKTERLSLLWPGRAYVDVVGLDGQLTKSWSTFYTCFGPTLAQIRRVTRAPVMISEVAVVAGRARPAQIAELFSAAHQKHITALDFFDVKTWSFDHDRATISALRRAAKAGR